jgi:hypothetical protein
MRKAFRRQAKAGLHLRSLDPISSTEHPLHALLVPLACFQIVVPLVKSEFQYVDLLGWGKILLVSCGRSM